MFKDKTIFKDWRFYFKLGFGCFFAATVLYTWLNPLINGIKVTPEQIAQWPNASWIQKDKGDFTFHIFSFFTIQTNIMVILWFILGAIFHDREGKIDSRWFGQYMTLAITTYITITGIIFNTMLLPFLTIEGFYGWFTNVVEHMVCPVVAIVYFLCFMKREKGSVLTSQLFWKKYLWKYFIYPIVWVIVMMIRGEFRYEAGKFWPYPYFFMNVHESTGGIAGGIWLAIAAIFIIAIVLGISTLFNWIAYKQLAKQK